MLTKKERHPIHKELFESGTTADYWREFHANESEFYGHVLGFKGLERSVIVLCVNGIKHLSRAAEQLYVGLSRARKHPSIAENGGMVFLTMPPFGRGTCVGI